MQRAPHFSSLFSVEPAAFSARRMSVLSFTPSAAAIRDASSIEKLPKESLRPMVLLGIPVIDSSALSDVPLLSICACRTLRKCPAPNSVCLILDIVCASMCKVKHGVSKSGHHKRGTALD